MGRHRRTRHRLRERVSTSSPELGTPNVRDLGTFHERFRHLPNQNPEAMTCERPQSLEHGVTLTDLSLRRPMEVLELLLDTAVDADRDRTNINISLTLTPMGQPAGHLHLTVGRQLEQWKGAPFLAPHVHKLGH